MTTYVEWPLAVAGFLPTCRPADWPSDERLKENSEMPKMKTKRAAMKRFKRTGTGKLKRWHANHTHILTKKSRKRKNKLQKSDLVSSADFRRVNRLLQA
jgi:large subunit ribosomal protein L35